MLSDEGCNIRPPPARLKHGMKLVLGKLAEELFKASLCRRRLQLPYDISCFIFYRSYVNSLWTSSPAYTFIAFTFSSGLPLVVAEAEAPSGRSDSLQFAEQTAFKEFSWLHNQKAGFA